MVEQKTPKVTDFFVQTVFNKQKAQKGERKSIKRIYGL